jgi:uncharacterized protein (DUF885 family)
VIDRLDLFIAVIGVVAAIVGSSAPLWMALSKKADKEDVARLEARMDTKLDALGTRMDTKLDALETRMDTKLDALETRMDTKLGALAGKVDSVETRLGASLTRVEGKLDALILRLVPEQLPPSGEMGAGRG